MRTHSFRYQCGRPTLKVKHVTTSQRQAYSQALRLRAGTDALGAVRRPHEGKHSRFVTKPSGPLTLVVEFNMM